MTLADGREPEPRGLIPGLGVAMVVVAVVSVACLPLRGVTDPDNLTMIYLAGVVLVAIRQGFWPAVLASVFSVLAFNILFIPPYYSLSALDPSAYLTFLIMLASSLFAATLSADLSARLAIADQERAGTRLLLDLAQDLAQAGDVASIERAIERRMGPYFKAETELVPMTGDDIDPGPEQAAIQIVGPVWSVNLQAPDKSLGKLVLTRASERPASHQQRLELETIAAMVSATLVRIAQAGSAAHLEAESESERLRNLLLSSLSHDLRTPLTVLSGTAANLARMRKKLPREAMEEVGDLNRQIAQLQKFTGNLLRIAAISSGRMQLNRQAYGISEIIGAAIGRFDEVRGARQIRTSLTGDIPLVDIDGALVEQVIVNLIDNAISHTRQDGTIRIAVRRASMDIEVRVADDGPGLTPGTEEAIFERFLSGRKDGADRAGPASHGLGLAICRGIVEAHGGTIRAANNEGLPGASFLFTLPVYADTTETRP